jgi:hypothetical protein
VIRPPISETEYANRHARSRASFARNRPRPLSLGYFIVVPQGSRERLEAFSPLPRACKLLRSGDKAVARDEGDDERQRDRALATGELRRSKPGRADFARQARHPVTVVLDGVSGKYNIGAIFRYATRSWWSAS